MATSPPSKKERNKFDQEVTISLNKDPCAASQMNKNDFHDRTLCRKRSTTEIFTLGKARKAVSQLEKYSSYLLLPSHARGKPKLKLT